jgi:hypothetical protein
LEKSNPWKLASWVILVLCNLSDGQLQSIRPIPVDVAFEQAKYRDNRVTCSLERINSLIGVLSRSRFEAMAAYY